MIEKQLKLKLKANKIGLEIAKLKDTNNIKGRHGREEQYDLFKERIALLEEEKQLVLQQLQEMEEEKEEEDEVPF